MRALILITVFCIAAIQPWTAFASSINSTTDASADSGGNWAGPGVTVRTGAESASAFSYTIMGSEDGNVTTSVTTERNGVRTTEVREQNIPAGSTVNIRVATSTSRGSEIRSNANINVNVNVPSRGGVRTTVRQNPSSSSTISVHPAPAALASSTLPLNITAWFRELLQSFLSVVQKIFSSSSS